MRNRSWTIFLLAGCLAGGALSGAEDWRPEESKGSSGQASDVDAKIHRGLPCIINEGAALYNCGDRAGCTRLWEGALLAYLPLLDHHPHLQRAIEEAMHKSASMTCPEDRAFVLRAILDRIRRETASQGRRMPPARMPPAAMPPAGKPAPEPVRPPTPPPPAEKSLWDRLGGAKGVNRVVHTFLNMVQNDARVNFYRKPNHKPGTREVETLQRNMVDFFSSQTGGPYEYKGESMKDAHRGMGITSREFDAAEEDLRRALLVHGVPTEDINLLMSIVETTRDDIVQPPPKPPAPKPPAGKPPTPKPPTHWQRLGGEAGVTRIVNDFLNSALADPRVDFFGKAKQIPSAEGVSELKRKFVEYLSSLTGGPLKYKGKSMRAVHAGMRISNAQFDAFLEHVHRSLERNKVKPADAAFLMDKFRELRAEIVQMPSANGEREGPGSE